MVPRADTPFSLYLHIPFCVRKCPYCDFNSYGVAVTGFPEHRYVEALLAELQYRSAAPEWSGRPIRTIFLGGGTPSLLRTTSVARLIQEIHRLFPCFPGIEITLEANPGTLSEELRLEKLYGFREAGVNRLSFGVQSFRLEKLRFLGRIHGPEDTYVVYDSARIAGFSNVNLDLIFGVAGEKVSTWDEELTIALSLAPEHISAYSLTIEPGTEFSRRARRGVILQAEDEEIVEMLELTPLRLKSVGYERYEISNYSQPGMECRHNLGYWSGGDYLGIGAGAHSFCSETRRSSENRRVAFGKRWSNIPGPEHYMLRVREPQGAIQFQEELTREQAESEFFLLGLRKREGVKLSAFTEKFGEDIGVRYPRVIDNLKRSGLIVAGDDTIRLTEFGFRYADTVFEAFIADRPRSS